ncbi:fungal-specific transcription factor domain-containing protein [Trichoderma sp. SZMC 28014]
MDAAHIFRQGLGTVAPRMNHAYAQPRNLVQSPDDFFDGDTSSHRVAHTLTACCRCRQRKTRCDPTLPRCLPCERSGSVCEYLDTAKARKINRRYVITLQDKVKALEAELAQYTDEDGDHPPTNEELVRPGGMIRLSGNDETPRYLGPSSGIAMTRLLMAEAKRFTESNKISDLIPEVRARSQARMQSIQITSNNRKKSYPMMSEFPAESLPARHVADRLVEIFYKKAQIHWPVLHEGVFKADVDAVYNGDTDSNKNFLVRMVIAISLHKLDTQYAGLGDSYYMAAMKYVEEIIRPKDLRSLQCLVLIGQYSLLTPTRTPVYYVIGLATRICQQEGLTDEKTLTTTGYNLDPQTIDLRRRLVWVVMAMEHGLSYYLGRPSAFAVNSDRLDIEFFSAADDANITPQGILDGPLNTRKLATIHFYKMWALQAEIKRTLYERKRPEPRNDDHPWFQNIEKVLRDWMDSTPDDPPFAKPWISGHYHQLRALLYRPSPQIPKPSAGAAQICYESSATIIDLSHKQFGNDPADMTWVFLLSLNWSLGTLLWAISYNEVRRNHPREEVEKLVNKALESLDRCAERWPGTTVTSQLYTIFAKACMQSYDVPVKLERDHFSFSSPPATSESQSSPESYSHSNATTPRPLPYLNPPQFGFVFDSSPETMNNYVFDPNYPPPQPTFRSNSIFCNPATDNGSRRFSYFPPDVTHMGEAGSEDPSSHQAQIPDHIPHHLQSPPEIFLQGNIPTSRPGLSPSAMAMKQTPNATPITPSPLATQTNMSPPHKRVIAPQVAQAQPTYAAARMGGQPIHQRPLPPAPTSVSDWFSPPSQFMSPYNFVTSGSGYFNEAMAGMSGFGGGSPGPGGLGLHNITAQLEAGGMQFGYSPGRQGSLSQSQQLELMEDLETDGVSAMDAYLQDNPMNGRGWY